MSKALNRESSHHRKTLVFSNSFLSRSHRSPTFVPKAGLSQNENAGRVMSDPDNVAPGSRRILCGDGAVAAMLDFGSGSSAFGLPTPEESGGHHTWCLLDVPVVSTFPFQSVQERFQQFLGHWIGHGRRHRKESGHPADIERRRLLPGEPTLKQVLLELRQRALGFLIPPHGSLRCCSTLTKMEINSLQEPLHTISMATKRKRKPAATSRLM